MKTLRLIWTTMLMAALLSSTAVKAEDTDLYSGLSGGSIPNLLLVLDNAANFSSNAGSCTYADDNTAPSLDGTAGGIEQCAIYNVVHGLSVNTDGSAKVNIGMMVYNANRFTSFGCPSGGNGGCLIWPIAPMTAANKTLFKAWIRTWTTTGNGADNIKASGEATAAAMQESWAYYAGQTGLSGRSYAGVSPSAGCQKNFVVFIGNAFSNSGTPGDGGSTNPYDSTYGLKNAPGVTTAQKAAITIPSGSYGTSTFSCGSYSMPSHSESSGLYADEWARYMYQTDIYGSYDDQQNIVTYTIGLLGTSCKPDYPALLKSMADVGGGKFFATSSYTEIQNAILKILNEVQAINSVFSSSSLPVSVNTQGTYLNQIFMGMFRPDAEGNPRWLGNLKQYQFIYDSLTRTLKLGDSTGAAAISSSATGFISPNAVSFWTSKDITTVPDAPSPTGTGGFWVNDSSGAGLTYDSEDGQIVEKGGAAQKQRLAYLYNNYTSGPGSRNLYTYCPSGTSCNAQLSATANAFTTTNVTSGMLAGSDVGISALSRSGTTAFASGVASATVTATTVSAHGLIAGNNVTVSGTGASPAEFFGSKSMVAASGTTFTYTITETPPQTATGTYTAAKASATTLTIDSLTRSGTTATAHTSTAHTYAVNNVLTITGASDNTYNTNVTVTAVNLPAQTFTFTVATSETPATSATGGTATWTHSGTSYSRTVTIARTAGATGVRVSTNTAVTSGNGQNKVYLIAAGETVTISGASSTDYNKSWTVTGNGGSGCTGLLPGGNANDSFFCLTATVVTSPATPDTGTSIQVAPVGATKTVTGITRGSSTISGTCPTATAPATATATTSTVHGFIAGDSVSLSCSGTCDSLYKGGQNVTVVSAPTTTTFTYSITTSPAVCATGTAWTASSTSSINATSLVNWVRGEDNVTNGEKSPDTSYTLVNVRPSIHGDVLHSRPVVINYGSGNVVAFYGANDGVYRAVKGNQTGTGAGTELWGFVPTEFYTTLNRLRENSPPLLLPSTPSGITPTPQKKDYYADGPTGIYQRLNADGSTNTAYIYIAMRRGGRIMYALNVTTATDPRYLWKIKNTDSDFTELGQTWSQPKVAQVAGYTNPVLIFGGGYDTNEDSEPPTADTMGRAIYIVDAITGALVWKASYQATGANTCSGTTTKAACLVTGMKYSIPADITLVDRDNDGKIDRLYASDTGGNIWRVDLEPTTTHTTPNYWQVTQLAALGCDTGVCSTGTPRKFFYPADVISVGTASATGSYDAVIISSGDREHPVYSTVTTSSQFVTNRLFMVKDTYTGKDGSARTSPVTQTSLFNATSTTYDKSGSGFYITFASGEKGVNAATTVAGISYLGTNQATAPSLTSCTNLGTARFYQVNPLTGATYSGIFDGGGLPPSPVAGVVDIGGGVLVPFIIGGGGDTTCTGPDCKSAVGGGKPKINVSTKRARTYWYRER
jgi:type IV pilus assembly protein PilY1